VVAIVLTQKSNPDTFLVVKRPDDDPDLRGSWGLPAATMVADELPEQAARRVCKEKLNCDAVPTRFLGLMFQKRNSYEIFLMDIEMELSGDKQPDALPRRSPNIPHTSTKNGPATLWS
jgi:8-oxo-dGTP pyrophosphatase MutT (NUDIX family)